MTDENPKTILAFLHDDALSKSLQRNWQYVSAGAIPYPLQSSSEGWTMPIEHIDCFDGLKTIADKSVKLLFTDMPYGTTMNHWDRKPDLPRLWAEYMRVIADDGCIALFSASPFDKELAMSNMQMYRYEWIWEKSLATGFLNASKMPLKAHENILIFYKKLPTYNPIMTKGHKKESSKASQEKCIQSSNYGKHFYRVDYCSTERYPRSVLKFPTNRQKEPNINPTQKPIELCKYIIQTYTNEGDFVLDTFAGSGSIPISCEILGRPYRAFEVRRSQVKKANDRLTKYRGEVGLFAGEIVA